MIEGKDFAVIQLLELQWPSIQLDSKRFRLFVAADVCGTSTEAISDFALAALNHGMVYFCAWGDGCSRFHDIVDEVLVEDDLGDRRFSGPNENDAIMTTWHERTSLDETLDFFANCAKPTEGFAAESSFRLVICVENSEWAADASRFLRNIENFG
jgi:hypothetical protein